MFTVKKSVAIITMIRAAAAKIEPGFKGATLPKVSNEMDIIEEVTASVERLMKYFLKAFTIKVCIYAGSLILLNILLNCIVEFPSSKAYMIVKNWSVKVVCAINSFEDSFTTSYRMIMAKIKKGNVNKVRFILASPKMAVRPNPMQRIRIAKFNCEKPTHKATVNARTNEKALRKR